MYSTIGNKIKYLGNNLHDSCIVEADQFNIEKNQNILYEIKNNPYKYHIGGIDNGIFFATTEFFKSIGSRRCNLPLTTLMISSPGEVYAGETLDYTTDALPIEIPNRFGSNRRIFLAESSQFYLEMNLLAEDVDSVFSIYNSFRKEPSDLTHLSEFQHIEYEGKIDIEECKAVINNLLIYIINYLVKNHKNDLLYFISEGDLYEKIGLIKKGPIEITFTDAMKLLNENTKDEKYLNFSMKNFGSWEEIRLTEILGGNVCVTKMPLMQIPFYHDKAEHNINGNLVANNADLILYGYRETIGAGQRIHSKEVLSQKAEIFSLPPDDYGPYLKIRDMDGYKTTSGFGLGRQRLTHWLTNQPSISESTIIPRTHLIPNP